SAFHLINALVERILIGGQGHRSHVRGHRRQRVSVGQVCGDAVLNHGDRICLAQAEALRTGTAERSDLWNAGNAADKSGEHSRLTNLGVETELESDVLNSVMVVVNLHLIANVGIEGEVVGSIGWLEEPVDVKDHGDAVGMMVTDKCVPVG